MPLHVSIGDRWRIISLRFDQGMPTTRIATIIHCSVQTVCSILQLFDETDNVIEREGRGRTCINDGLQTIQRQLETIDF